MDKIHSLFGSAGSYPAFSGFPYVTPTSQITKIQKSPIPSKYFPENFQKITKNTVTISPIKPILPILPIKIPPKREPAPQKRCRLSTRKGSHILYCSTAAAQTSFIFHLSSFIFLTTPVLNASLSVPFTAFTL